MRTRTLEDLGENLFVVLLMMAPFAQKLKLSAIRGWSKSGVFANRQKAFSSENLDRHHRLPDQRGQGGRSIPAAQAGGLHPRAVRTGSKNTSYQCVKGSEVESFVEIKSSLFGC